MVRLAAWKNSGCTWEYDARSRKGGLMAPFLFMHFKKLNKLLISW